MQQLNSFQKYALWVTMVILGVMAILCNDLVNLAFNIQNSQIVFVNSDDEYGQFNHPFIQTFCMFLAESLCFPLYLIMKQSDYYKSQAQDALDQGKVRINKLLVVIPTLCDSVGGLCIYISLNFLPPSVNQIVTSGIIVTSAILSRIMLKRIFSKMEISGCICVLIGVLCVGLSGFIFPDKEQTDEGLFQQTLSISLLGLAVCVYGIQYTIEEKYFNTYFLHPLEMVGTEGMWGLSFYTIICTIMTFTPCPDSLKGMCVPHDGIYYFERVDYFFSQFTHNVWLQIFIPIGILGISSYNTACLTVTKYCSCVTRVIIDVCKILLIWIISLIVTFTTKYEWENTRISAIIMEAIGFIIVIVGEILYNQKNTLQRIEDYNILSLQGKIEN